MVPTGNVNCTFFLLGPHTQYVVLRERDFLFGKEISEEKKLK
jgi:hypothetical protein